MKVLNKDKRTRFIRFLFLLGIIFFSIGSISSANAQISQEELEYIQNVKESINLAMTVFLIAVAIIIGLITILIIVVYLSVSNTKKYLQRVDQLIGIRQSQRYGNWDNQDPYQKY